MDVVEKRLHSASTALASFQELATIQQPSVVQRDAAIQRFEYTFEASWKAAKVYLREVEGLEAGSPKRVVRECFTVGLLTEEQTRTALQMTDDRNLTSHTYHEGLAAQIFARLAGYAGLMERWIDVMLQGIEGG